VRDGTSRGNFLRPVPCTHLVNEGVFESTPRNGSLATTHSSLALQRRARASCLSPPSGAQSRSDIEQVGSVINRSAGMGHFDGLMAVPAVGCWPNANAANSSRPRAFFFFLCSRVIFWTGLHGAAWGRMGINPQGPSAYHAQQRAVIAIGPPAFRLPVAPATHQPAPGDTQGNASRRQLAGRWFWGAELHLHQRRYSRAAGASALLQFECLRKATRGAQAFRRSPSGRPGWPGWLSYVPCSREGQDGPAAGGAS
jgi:hypothetical protein